jgi:hypothetical protein
MTVADMQKLEDIASDLIAAFNIKSPPIPIESMLQHPGEGMWAEVDIVNLSSSFINVRELYSPRMSLARWLARQVIKSPWGEARSLQSMIQTDDDIHTFARMLIMPLPMIKALSSGARMPTTMSLHFEVPEEDARLRLMEIAGQL